MFPLCWEMGILASVRRATYGNERRGGIDFVSSPDRFPTVWYAWRVLKTIITSLPGCCCWCSVFSFYIYGRILETSVSFFNLARHDFCRPRASLTHATGSNWPHHSFRRLLRLFQKLKYSGREGGILRLHARVSNQKLATFSWHRTSTAWPEWCAEGERVNTWSPHHRQQIYNNHNTK